MLILILKGISIRREKSYRVVPGKGIARLIHTDEWKETS